MKKIIVFLGISILLFTGCDNAMSTPTERVEEFLGKYQSMDSEVLAQLDSVISDDADMNDDQKKEYRSLMEKQYQNLAYKIKDETITDDTATVDVEIEVYDYATSIAKSRKYYDEHKDEFDDGAEATIDVDENADNSNDATDGNNDIELDENNNTGENTTNNNDVGNDGDGNASNNDAGNGDDGNIIEEAKGYIDYKLKQLKTVTDKVKYDITFNLTKVDGEWQIEDISDSDRQKIHGLFEG